MAIPRTFVIGLAFGVALSIGMVVLVIVTYRRSFSVPFNRNQEKWEVRFVRGIARIHNEPQRQLDALEWSCKRDQKVEELDAKIRLHEIHKGSGYLDLNELAIPLSSRLAQRAALKSATFSPRPLRSLAIPLAIPLLLVAIPTGWAAARLVRHMRRDWRGLCPNCGYDIRASPDRCPACGQVRRQAQSTPV
jgi:hypothetical protein